MASGMGRGSRLLQALKEKEKKEEKPAEEKTPTSPLVQRAQVSASEPVATPAIAQISSPPRPRPMGRGGMIASLLSKQAQPAPAAVPSPVSKPVQPVTTPEAPKIEEPEPKSVLITKEPEMEPKATRIIPRGRGLLVSKLQQAVKPAQEPVSVPVPIVKPPSPVALPTPTPKLVTPPAPAPKYEEPSIVTKMETMSITRKIETRSDITKKSETGSAEIAKKSTVSTDTKYMSIATISSKASDELKVEQIMRKSPVRKMGEAGTQSLVATNYIKLKCKNEGVYQYVVHFDPPVDSQYNRVKMLHHLKEVTGDVRLFDGYTLFLPKRLPDKTTIAKVKRRVGDTDILYTLKIQLTKILQPEQIPPTVFSIIFKNIMKELKMSRIGQHYFSPMRQIEVSTQNLQIWPGYTTAVHEYEDGLYLVLDVAHKVLRSQTCLDMMKNLHHKHGGNQAEFKEAVFNNICGNIVLTKYNNRTYRVDDILWEQNPMSKFVYHNNEEITYVDYYKKHYDIDIKDKSQPLLFHRAKTKEKDKKPGSSPTNNSRDVLCLIPELCFMTGLNDELRNDFNVKKDLAVHTRLSPSQRFDQLQILIENIRKTPEAVKQITNWGLELDDDLNIIEGRVLPPEKIIFAKKEFETDFKCDWTRPAGNEECISSVDMKHWMVVYPNIKESIVAKFCDLAYECGKKIGVKMTQPHTVPLPNDRPDTYYNEIKKNLREHTQMVVIIFPMLSDSRYTRVKRLCCIECPVPSQVICLKTINKPDNQLRSVAQKIVLQMNVKLGGEIWRLSIPIKKMMIIGIDVYHKTDKKYKSIAGFVSSLNHDQTRWYSKVCFQMVGQELADTLKTAFLKSIRKYQEVNNFLPEKIFIFRDGVSEGQIPIVSEHEVTQLKSVFNEDYQPQISVIIVQKRISTRIFAQGKGDGNIVNPPPGTIIDYNITSKELYDYYLVSQHVGQGTVTPTHYIVAYDDTKFKPDYVQRLSYKMTHMYYNWSGTIRVPAPCQYAHKLAFLTGQYLQEEASDALCNRLFYL